MKLYFTIYHMNFVTKQTLTSTVGKMPKTKASLTRNGAHSATVFSLQIMVNCYQHAQVNA